MKSRHSRRMVVLQLPYARMVKILVAPGWSSSDLQKDTNLTFVILDHRWFNVFKGFEYFDHTGILSARCLAVTQKD
jgi:hypothetical protein